MADADRRAQCQWTSGESGPESIRASTRAIPVEPIENPHYSSIQIEVQLRSHEYTYMNTPHEYTYMSHAHTTGHDSIA